MDNRWAQQREDLPRLIRAGRHLARPRRYLRGLGLDVEPAELPSAAAEQARLGDGWVKIVADWIDRDRGDLPPPGRLRRCVPRSQRPTRREPA